MRPFLALRSYLPPGHSDKAKEIGSEATPADFLDTLLALTAEWRRVLAPHGSIAVELGDTYSGSGGGGGDYLPGGRRQGQQQFAGAAASMRESNAAHWRLKNQQKDAWPLDKSLCGIPHLYHLSLAYGRNLLTGTPSPAGQWRVRNVVAWCRPNPPVGALGDKVRPATSYMTVACVSPRRYFDLDAVRYQPTSGPAGAERPDGRQQGSGYRGVTDGGTGGKRLISDPAGAPPLDWWEPLDEELALWDQWADELWKIPTASYSGAHYATWPPALCVRPIEAMCPRRVCVECGRPSERITETKTVDRIPGNNTKGRDEKQHRFQERTTTTTTTTTTGWTDCGHANWRNGVVLDPFAGSGTTLAVAVGHGRDAIGIDLDSRNVDLARGRVGMFLDVVEQERIA